MVFGRRVIGQRQAGNRHRDGRRSRRRHRGGEDPDHEQQTRAERRCALRRNTAARNRPLGPLHRIERPIEVVVEDDAAGVERGRRDEEPGKSLGCPRPAIA